MFSDEWIALFSKSMLLFSVFIMATSLLRVISALFNLNDTTPLSLIASI